MLTWHTQCPVNWRRNYIYHCQVLPLQQSISTNCCSKQNNRITCVLSLPVRYLTSQISLHVLNPFYTKTINLIKLYFSTLIFIIYVCLSLASGPFNEGLATEFSMNFHVPDDCWMSCPHVVILNFHYPHNRRWTEQIMKLIFMQSSPFFCCSLSVCSVLSSNIPPQHAQTFYSNMFLSRKMSLVIIFQARALLKFSTRIDRSVIMQRHFAVM